MGCGANTAQGSKSLSFGLAVRQPAPHLEYVVGPYEVPRRESRLRLQIPVRLLVRSQPVDMRTEDVSFSGMFLRTDSPPPVRGLVRFEVEMDGRRDPLQMTGMVVHVIPANSPNGRTAGLGLQFYGVGADVRGVWTRYLQMLRERHPDSEARSVVVSQPSRQRTEPVRRKHERFAAVLEVRVQTVAELGKMFTRDISRGGAFLSTESTEDRFAAGDRLFVELIHPQSDDVYGLECTVRRSVRDGVGVEFDGFDDQLIASLADFIAPIEELSFDDLLIDE